MNDPRDPLRPAPEAVPPVIPAAGEAAAVPAEPARRTTEASSGGSRAEPRPSDADAVLDIRDLRSLVDCIRLVRRTAMQTAVRMITTAVMLALLAGIAIKLKIFGGGP